jgi:hypothetical protein
MIYAKDHKQGYLLDPWDYLGPKRRQLMEQSWAGLFREEILNNLPVWELARHYDRSNGRPAKELYTAPGIQILQHMNELTGEETIGQLAFNTKWHYALDIAEESDEAKYISLKTLWNIRQVIIEHGIDTFSVLLRILEEQCLVTKTPEENPVEVAVKPAKEVSSESLQNPSDPDAPYDGHKGQGYQVQVMETYCDTKEPEVRETTLNLITHIEPINPLLIHSFPDIRGCP